MGALQNNLHWFAAVLAGVNIGLGVALSGWLGLLNAVVGLSLLAVGVALLHNEHFSAWVTFVDRNHIESLRAKNELIEDLLEQRRQMRQAMDEAGIVRVRDE